MQFISKYNKKIKYLCFISTYRKCAWVVPLKDKKCITTIIAFQKIIDKSWSTPSKIWKYKDIEFYNRSMKSWLQDNDLKMYSIYNEGKSVFAERFIRILKNKIYKYLTLMLRNVHIYKLDSIVDKFNNR